MQLTSIITVFTKYWLLPKILEMLLFLKYNLRAILYDTELETPPQQFKAPNSSIYDAEGYKDEEEENLYLRY